MTGHVNVRQTTLGETVARYVADLVVKRHVDWPLRCIDVAQLMANVLQTHTAKKASLASRISAASARVAPGVVNSINASSDRLIYRMSLWRLNANQ